jgi:hypothetical protein
MLLKNLFNFRGCVMLVRQHIGLQLSACLATFGTMIPLNLALNFFPLLNDVALALAVLVDFADTRRANGRNREI